MGLSIAISSVMAPRVVDGRVTDEVIEQIKILQTLGTTMMGADIGVALIHHTDCGASLFTMPQVAETLTEDLRADRRVIDSLAIVDPVGSIHTDIERLRSAEILPDEMLVAGYVYDVNDGHLREIIAPGALRESIDS